MSYAVFILRRAQKELANLPVKNYEQIKRAIYRLNQNPRPMVCQKLKGLEGCAF